MSVKILIAADGAPWEAALLRDLDELDLGVEVFRRCLDVVELVSIARAGQAQVAVVSSRLRGLDAEVVDQLVLAGVRPVGVLAVHDEAERDFLHATGVVDVAAADASIHEMAATILGANPSGRPGDRVRPSSRDLRGKVVAVWGPTGAPGRTLVATTVADEISRLRANVLLVDADVYGGSVATRLGIVDESPGLAAACRLAAHGPPEPAELAALSWQLGPWLRVMTGIPLAQRWSDLRPAAVESVLRAWQSMVDWVVVDLGFSIEAAESRPPDSTDRNGATRVVLELADFVLVVGEADPVGIQRLAYALEEFDEATVTGSTRVVLNKVRRGFGLRDPEREVARALTRHALHSPVALLPFDPEAADACLALGRTLGQVRPRCRLRRAIATLAHEVTGIEPTSSAHRRAKR